jgi:hydrogenase 3 maturation protease
MDATLERLATLIRGRRAAVVGVGNRLRGDDGAGSRLAERLRGRCRAPVFDAETVPENYLGALVAADPELVLFVDAADHGGPPGALCLVRAGELAPRVASTHALTLLLLARTLEARGMTCWMLGIQPAVLGPADTLSVVVAAAARAAEDALANALDTPEAAHA